MTTRPTLLAFDTSAAYCAAAVIGGSEILASETQDMARGQAEALLPLAERTLAQAGVALKNLDAIACGTGPGNFTGTRISVALARGLALGAGIPAIGVSLLDAYDPALPGLTCVAARRGFVYVKGTGGLDPGQPEMIALDALAARFGMASGLACFGPAAVVVASGIGGFVGATPGQPAVAVAEFAANRWRDGGPFERPVPQYLRPADAAPARDAPPVLLT